MSAAALKASTPTARLSAEMTGRRSTSSALAAPKLRAQAHPRSIQRTTNSGLGIADTTSPVLETIPHTRALGSPGNNYNIFAIRGGSYVAGNSDITLTITGTIGSVSTGA